MSVVAAGVLFLTGILALVCIDLLRTVQAQSLAQAAGDAAALAAAQEIAIPSGSWSPTDAARSYAERNGATLLSCQCEVGGKDAVVRVQVHVRLLIVGPDRTTDAWARAVVGPDAAAP
ncbi:MAG: hypothetical protein ABR518_05610 [Actinomycetota bacterium]